MCKATLSLDDVLAIDGRRNETTCWACGKEFLVRLAVEPAPEEP